jgi:RimJ/RimL family protein N-acetyltransferase
MLGQSCRLEPLTPERHAARLFEVIAQEPDARSWTYMPYGPFPDLAGYVEWMTSKCLGEDPLFFAIVDLATDFPVGVASYLRITPRSGSIEVGHLHFTSRLQKSRAATEAMYLMMSQAFELGYRRYEWKCDSLNAPSRAAALRLGFKFEGIFRQATVYKERTRDSAWFAVIDSDWPRLKASFEAWLSPDNFDGAGRQRRALSEFQSA